LKKRIFFTALFWLLLWLCMWIWFMKLEKALLKHFKSLIMENNWETSAKVSSDRCVSTLSGHETICIVLCHTNKLDSEKFQGHFQFSHEHPSLAMEWSSPCLLCWIRDQVSPLAWAMLSTHCHGLEGWDFIMTLRSGVADQSSAFSCPYWMAGINYFSSK
jgi:hypothetical protein